jgi:hypothetical protein
MISVHDCQAIDLTARYDAMLHRVALLTIGGEARGE